MATKKAKPSPKPIEEVELMLLRVPLIENRMHAIDYLEGDFADAIGAISDLAGAGVAGEATEMLAHDLRAVCGALAEAIRIDAPVSFKTGPGNEATLAREIEALHAKLTHPPAYENVPDETCNLFPETMRVLFEQVAGPMLAAESEGAA